MAGPPDAKLPGGRENDDFEAVPIMLPHYLGIWRLCNLPRRHGLEYLSSQRRFLSIASVSTKVIVPNED